MMQKQQRAQQTQTPPVAPTRTNKKKKKKSSNSPVQGSLPVQQAPKNLVPLPLATPTVSPGKVEAEVAQPQKPKVYNLSGPRQPGAFLAPKKTADNAEELAAFRLKMRSEMAGLRKQLADSEPQAPPQTEPTVKGPKPPIQRPIKARPQVRARLDSALHKRVIPQPTVGISNRPGFGYDTSVFTNGKAAPITPTSLPPGFKPLPESVKNGSTEAEAEKTRVQEARDPKAVAKHLANVHGLFIPGGQDREADNSVEKTGREEYEQALIYAARQRGLPVLAVCGGSRCLARGFGGKEQLLSEEDQQLHDKGKAEIPAHPIEVRPSTIIGGARAKGASTKISSVNSTHVKVVAHNKGEKPQQTSLSDINRLPNGTPELTLSAIDPTGNPEGFETTHGAPIVGVTSHPEALFRHGKAREQFGHADAIDFSDRLFKGFAQSMQTYAARPGINEQVRNFDKTRLRRPKT